MAFPRLTITVVPVRSRRIGKACARERIRRQSFGVAARETAVPDMCPDRELTFASSMRWNSAPTWWRSDERGSEFAAHLA